VDIKSGWTIPRRSFIGSAAGWAWARRAGAAQASGAGRPVRLARDLRNGWGVCTGVPQQPENAARALAYLNTRRIRGNYIVGQASTVPSLTAVNDALRRAGAQLPSLDVQCLIFAYMNDLAITWAVNQRRLMELYAARLLSCIEGPNEMNSSYVGGGSHGPYDKVSCADPRYGAGGDGSWPLRFRQWATEMAKFRTANRSLARVRLVAPTVAVAPQAVAGAAYFDQLPALAGVVVNGAAHYYAGGGHSPNLGSSSTQNSNIGNFGNTYSYIARAEQLPLILSECGASTDGVNYGRDGIGQCRYILNQFFDLFASGGGGVFFYELFDGSGAERDYEGNFGLFREDAAHPKPAAIALANLANLLSLRNVWNDQSNLVDSFSVRPAYNSASLVVTGADAADTSVLVLPKSDGHTMIAVWHEVDPLDPYGHAPFSIMVDLGAALGWRLFDPTGPRGDIGQAQIGVTPIATGSGREVPVTLRGYPLLIELSPP
jgi:hypothetical protein